ncbi:hypothetical protein L7F22_029226 [Adiantum nelumboides]|nr:hypothetical protein [Adiantum nelumboides]
MWLITPSPSSSRAAGGQHDLHSSSLNSAHISRLSLQRRPAVAARSHGSPILDLRLAEDETAVATLMSAPHPSLLNLASLLLRELASSLRFGCGGEGASAAALAFCNIADTLITCLLSPSQLQPAVDPRLQLRGNSFPVPECPPTPCFVTSGTLPPDLSGAYIRNGPNPAFLHNGEGFHLFDGDGMLHCVSFRHGTATYCARFVNTSRFRQEQAAGRPLFPKFWGSLTGIFGMARVAVMVMRESLGLLDLSQGSGLSNTSVGFFRGQVLSMSEEDLPYVIKVTEEGDLVTQGRLEVEGRRSMCAHPKIDTETGDMYAFSYPDPFEREAHFTILKMKASEQEAGKEKSAAAAAEAVAVPGLLDMPIVHDFAITRKHIVFPDSELVVSPLAFMRGEGVAVRDGQKVARFCVLPRDIFDRPQEAPQEACWFDAPALNCLHYMNAWDDEETQEVVVIAPVVSPVENAFSFTGVTSTLSEIRLNLQTGNVTCRQLCEGLELGTMNHRFLGCKSRYAYFVEGSHFPHAMTAIVKVDVQLGCTIARKTFEKGCSGGEPCFVPRCCFHQGHNSFTDHNQITNNMGNHNKKEDFEEDDGYLLCFVYNNTTHCSQLLVMDALSPSLEVIACIQLPSRVPFGIHGYFVSSKQLDM